MVELAYRDPIFDGYGYVGRFHSYMQISGKTRKDG